MAKSKSKQRFEESLRELEQIVEAIERGEIGLEESIQRYDDGMKLIQRCRAVLSDAELKIQQLQAGPDGGLQAAAMPAASDVSQADDR